MPARHDYDGPWVLARGNGAEPSLDLSGRAYATSAAPESFPGIKPGSSGGVTAKKPFPESIRQEALAENVSQAPSGNPTCVYCRMETSTPQVDHAIPKVQGGNATIENAQVACPHCNASKGGRDFPVTPPAGYEGPWPPWWWPTG
jgi:hypothetical protein